MRTFTRTRRVHSLHVSIGEIHDIVLNATACIMMTIVLTGPTFAEDGPAEAFQQDIDVLAPKVVVFQSELPWLAQLVDVRTSPKAIT